MKHCFSIVFSLLFFISVFSQNTHPFVKLEERIKGKRLELFAVNSNSINYDVFLRVETEDFRRSSARPVIKTIPANSEIRLITMVKLNGTEGNYSTTFVVNEIAKALSMRKDHEDFEIKLDNALHKKQIIIYTKEACDLCTDTKSLLRQNKIKYTEYGIDKDSLNLMKLIKDFKVNQQNTKALAPILKIEDSLYTNLRTTQDVIDALKNHY